MKEKEYRKLDADLPTQPLVNTKPWEVAGWVFVILLVVIAIVVAILK